MGSSGRSDFGRKLYGRRKGPKRSVRQEELRRTLLPRLTLKLILGADPRTYFLTPLGGKADPTKRGVDGSASPERGDVSPVTDVWLEIGFGAGEHLLAQSRTHPDVGLIGAEPYESGVAKLLSKVDEEFSSTVYGGGPAERGRGGINIRIHEGDARDVIDALPDSSLGRVFILFPDPWPKTRHHKRRFVQTELLDALARVMKSGAELRFASDDEGYLTWTLERLAAHPAFAWSAVRQADWKTRPPGWPPTRYEAKALHGPPAYLLFRRRSRMPV